MIQFYSGDPGSGKSAIAVQNSPSTCPILSTGDEIRKAQRGADLRFGDWGPDDLVEGFVRGIAHAFCNATIDGFPRRPHQVSTMQDIQYNIRAAGFPSIGLLWVTVSPQAAVDRIKRIDARTCTFCGGIGPKGTKCLCGGTHADAGAAEHYLKRRSLQQPELEATLALCSDLPYFMTRDMSEVLG